MNLRHHKVHEVDAIVQLFSTVFADSEGEVEGTLIGRLAEDLFASTDERDLFNFVADEDGQIVGSIFFSRLDFEDGRDAFILAPVAVHSDRQRNGIGHALIEYGLMDLTARGVQTALTYGNPAFYEKIGFRQISAAKVVPPFKLSQPEGWLGQSLVDEPVEELSGNCRCVNALNAPIYW